MRRLKVSSPAEVTSMQRAVSAGIAGLFAACTAYTLFFFITEQSALNWSFLGIAAGVGVLFGAVLGATTKAGGVLAGVFAGFWIVMEVLLGVFIMLLELIAAMIAGLFSIFS